ncbi:hypothetical protein CL619_00040 [archaeon]|nr:hypothetical protein [archaeon]
MKNFLSSIIVIILILSLPLTLAENQLSLEDLANYESLTFDITISTGFELEETSTSSNLDSAVAKLQLKAQDSNNYIDILSESTSSEGELFENRTEFTFTYLEPLNKETKYFATVKVDSSKHIISNQKTFPIQLTETEIEENNLAEYLEVTNTIDWNNDEIKLQASTLAQGQTDLFESLVTMASWVEQNIEYNLSTLNADSSQKASYVLENREGVCDEMTSLFISFARSLGIPARFVSGLTYTRSDLFNEPWQSHGWAEVYLPEIGWVSFDPTFGQYGFVDATHIPLQYSNDPTEVSIYYEWTANNILLNSKDIDFDVQISDYGSEITSLLEVETEPFTSMVDFGSYNLLSATIKNQQNSYRAVELILVKPEEISSISQEDVVVVIGPEQEQTQEWIVQIEENLEPEFIYTFPYYIFANNNVNGTNTFNSATFNPSYSYEEVLSLISTSEVSLNSEISFRCSYENTISIEDSSQIECNIENQGNKIIEDARVCIAEICENFDLLLTETKTILQGISFEETGFQNIQTSLIYDDIEQNDILSIQVLDDANIAISINNPSPIKFKDIVSLQVNLERTSVAKPQNISIEVTTPTEILNMDLSSLEDKETIYLEFDSSKLTFENDVMLIINWQDELEENYSLTQIIKITVEAESILDNLLLFANKILHFLTV